MMKITKVLKYNKEKSGKTNEKHNKISFKIFFNVSYPPPPPISFQMMTTKLLLLYLLLNIKKSAAISLSKNSNFYTHQYSGNNSPYTSHDQPNAREPSKFQPPIHIFYVPPTLVYSTSTIEKYERNKTSKNEKFTKQFKGVT